MAIPALCFILALWAFGAVFDNPPLPRLVANMSGDFYGDDFEFKRRVRSAYLSPVSLATLTIGLAEQGYVIERKSAVFETSDFACRYTWSISWQVEGDKATRINGMFIPTCL
jgi:hypothetical protein